MNARGLLLVPLLLLAGPTTALPAPEAVLERRTAAAARRILERTDRVIIAGFRVVFRLAADPGGDAGRGGLLPEEYQRITEEAYADFKSQLTQAGAGLLGPEVLKASPGYRELALAPVAGAGAGRQVFAPAELPLFVGHFDHDSLHHAPPDLGNWRALNQLSLETRAVVLVPTLTVELAPVPPGAAPRIALVPGQTRVVVIHAPLRLAGDLGNFHLDERLVMPAGPAAPGPADYSRLSLDALRAFNRAAGAFIAAR